MSLIYPILCKFTQLHHLNLSDNSLTNLPNDLSGLKNLTSLNINNNLFESISEIVQSLKTIPNLIILNINLEDNDQVKIVLEELPGLQILNEQNISIEKGDDQEEEQEDLEDQDNKLDKKEVHQEVHIKKYDHEVEPLENIEGKVEKMELSPKIEKEEVSSRSKGDLLEISGDQPERLKVFAGIYESMRTLTKAKDPNKDKEMAEEFDLCLRQYIEQSKVNEKSQKTDLDKIRLFFPFFELCSSKLTEYIGIKDKQIEAICQLLFKEYDDALNEIC